MKRIHTLSLSLSHTNKEYISLFIHVCECVFEWVWVWVWGDDCGQGKVLRINYNRQKWGNMVSQNL